MSFDRGSAKRMVHLSRIAYRSETTAEQQVGDLGLTEFKFFSGRSTQAITARDGDTVILGFRGSEREPIDWAMNAQFSPVQGELGGRVHKGFRLALDEVWDSIGPVVLDGQDPVLITGHSLGGALAILAAARMVDEGKSPAGVYTYGQPRVGQADFTAQLNAGLGDEIFRVINHIDIVTRIPFLSQGYRHSGLRMYFDRNGQLHEAASAWRIAVADILYRLTHFGRIRAAGLDPHHIDRYVQLTDAL